MSVVDYDNKPTFIKISQFNLFGSRNDTVLNESLAFFRKIICYNQGKFVEFEHNVANKHKELRILIDSDPKREREIKQASDALLDYATKEMDSIFSRNFTLINEFFHGRGAKAPRICVKLIDHGQVVDVYRDRIDKSSKMRYLIKDNTGFKYVQDEGRYFFCNNIPEVAIRGDYRNPRLDANRVRLYKLPEPRWWKRRASKSNNKGVDYEWVGCWDDYDGIARGVNPESCYKSTLITPLTLVNNDEISKLFKEKFFLGRDEKTRMIQGFLCFDHTEVNFFNEEPDKDFGYIMADLLSLYVFTVYTHTSKSQTYLKSREIAKKLCGVDV